MRSVIVALIGIGLVSSAQAADLDMLRGSSGFLPPAPAFQRWDGFYGGAQAGLAVGSANFTGESNAIAADMLRVTNLEAEANVSSWGTVGHADTGNSATYGGFAGYNFQWDEIVFGIEANYMRTNISAQSSGGLSRILTLSDQYQYDITSTGSAQIKVTDIGTLRGRIGYAFDRFLGYVSLGGAAGYASYGATASVSYPTPQYAGPPPLPTASGPPAVSLTATNGKTNAVIYGFSAGLGIDMALTQNIFLRGEYEYIQFSQNKLGINNVRGAIGLKF